MVNCNDCKFDTNCQTKINFPKIVTCGRFCSKVSINMDIHNNFYKNSNKPNKNQKISDRKSSKPLHEERKNNLKKIMNNSLKNAANKILTYNTNIHDNEWNKRKILNDMEKGRGGPDIAGFKKMYGGYTSSIIEDATHLSHS